MNRSLGLVCSSLLLAAIVCGCAGSAGIGRTSGKSVSLKDDYYEYINGPVVAQKQIRAGNSSWTYYDEIEDRIYKQLNGILDESVRNRKKLPADSVERRIANLYLSACDIKGRENAGLGNLKPLIDAIQNAEDIPSYLDAVAKPGLQYGFGASLLYFSVGPDRKNAVQNVLWLYGPDLGLGKAVLEDPEMAEVTELYQQLIAALLLQNGCESSEDSAAKDAASIIELEKNIAASSLSLSDEEDPEKTYNVYSAQQLRELMPSANIPSVAAKAGLPEQPFYIVTDPGAMKKVDSLLVPANLPVLKKYAEFVVLMDSGPYLSIESAELIQNAINMASGVSTKKSRDVIAREQTQSVLGFEFGKIYVQKYFPESSKKDVEKMTREIMDVFRKRIDGLDWMEESTKAAAKRKLDTMDVHIGYPDKWPEYQNRAKILAPDEGGSFINNVLELKHTVAQHHMDSLGKPVETGYWSMTPQTVNAYYSASKNEIVLSAGILQPPFYDPHYSYAQNLGGTGQTIGHELSHAFDAHGAKYDEYGNLHNWWTDKDRQKFLAESKKISDYYSAIVVIDNIHIKGEQTIGEDIADLAGMELSIAPLGSDQKALREYCEIYAKAWAYKVTDKFLKLCLNTDVHSPFKTRCNEVLRSSPEFYLAYPEIKEGDGMYLAPEKRLGIW